MNYQIRDGIVLIEICDRHFLVSTTALRGICPYIVQINDSGAYIWNQLNAGSSITDIKKGIHENYEISMNADIDNYVDQFINELINANYLMECNK